MYEFNGITMWSLQAIAIDFAIIIALFVSLKYIKGWVSNLHANDEITERDNFAFGISFAAGLVALAIVLTGVSSGAFAVSLQQEALQMAAYGLLAIVLIKLGHFFQDKVALRKVSLHDEIVKGNVTAAVIDFGHVVSVAIVIRSALFWVATEGWHGLPIVIAAFIIGSIALLLVSQYRVQLFKRTNRSGDCLQQAIVDGNLAVGIRYAGFLIGSALALTAASGIAPYAADSINTSLIFWAISALVSLIAFIVLHLITIKIILSGCDISDEVNRQKNVGVATISAAISFAVGITMATLLGA
ncbi:MULTISPECIES: DUF350 domain-containing protein [Pseudoalteromonas]|jgi:uncharacterized membrane protein YjfL (UPF0719 family)|uniref:DUF350 domain-containing protein n=2 Tax=Pseudoalteromonas TaxID=53246 RepID=A0ABY3F8K1_9GAMM|nr:MULTISPECIES: DUF350 domain-containing protein [Pseudoalteromonas]MBB1311559.1 DUF350 domain-containing protein [Pseudoalteromonas sp. SR41-8]MBB1343725.1 DUF350 domain-containing protein [Pseudoalteromonas sp. SR45-6]MBB1399784.1 DUF350 domain-containing protein [Pseudoalteromonas sp. SG44-8]MBB1436152.1 DUF350 domain-containing protein [Pseudoalteromonas sp. SG43-6]MBB1507704.1 DUF350 domain-containing protein [Pseudoalteromonas sp. SG41-1]|tara:strand:+ start:1093 stop:1992 length:900 start_codon:yes stop_codon:yes gene_type:complete